MESDAKISLPPVSITTQLNHVRCVLKFFMIFSLASESVCKWVSSCVRVAVCVSVDAIKNNITASRVNPLDRSLKYRTNKVNGVGL